MLLVLLTKYIYILTNSVSYPVHFLGKLFDYMLLLMEITDAFRVLWSGHFLRVLRGTGATLVTWD